VAVDIAGLLSIDGSGSTIATSTGEGTRGNAGSVMVTAGQITLISGGEIASTTAGMGVGGSVFVTTPGALLLDDAGVANTQIAASATGLESGPGGSVSVTAGSLTVKGGAQIASTTSGPGKGGTVQVIAQGPLSLSDPGSGIIALANSSASGDAGSVKVGAPQIAVSTGAEIASTTAGTGAGGSVDVTTPGALVLNGAGIANTQIAASATGLQSGPGGSVSVTAGSLTVEGGAQIASSTAGRGKGGDVNITVASDIVLPDPGPQITAQSTGSGDAGSITVSAVRVLMNNGAAISTEAATSTANGGNITLHLRDFLYLVSSEISTSVKGETGNGGNIAIDPHLVILDRSSIIAQAVEGHGGNITITADQFIPSSDSLVSASSQLGISGTVVINGPRVDVNGALVVLSTQLRGRTEVLREACESRAGRPLSSFVEAGRGGLPQDPEATLPALYIAGRDLDLNPETPAGTAELSGAPLHTIAHLTMRCS
jgi:large exoprotein involved in heme utilization and adhesion